MQELPSQLEYRIDQKMKRRLRRMMMEGEDERNAIATEKKIEEIEEKGGIIVEGVANGIIESTDDGGGRNVDVIPNEEVVEEEELNVSKCSGQSDTITADEELSRQQQQQQQQFTLQQFTFQRRATDCSEDTQRVRNIRNRDVAMDQWDEKIDRNLYQPRRQAKSTRGLILQMMGEE